MIDASAEDVFPRMKNCSLQLVGVVIVAYGEYQTANYEQNSKVTLTEW
jgi:hypothetical protein